MDREDVHCVHGQGGEAYLQHQFIFAMHTEKAAGICVIVRVCGQYLIT
jgi:pyruvate-formate lyase-activating enzyme